MLDHVQALAKIFKNSLRIRKPVIYWFFEPETVLTNLYSNQRVTMFADTRREAFLPRKWITRAEQVTCVFFANSF